MKLWITKYLQDSYHFRNQTSSKKVQITFELITLITFTKRIYNRILPSEIYFLHLLKICRYFQIFIWRRKCYLFCKSSMSSILIILIISYLNWKRIGLCTQVDNLVKSIVKMFYIFRYLSDEGNVIFFVSLLCLQYL